MALSPNLETNAALSRLQRWGAEPGPCWCFTRTSARSQWTVRLSSSRIAVGGFQQGRPICRPSFRTAAPGHRGDYWILQQAQQVVGGGSQPVVDAVRRDQPDATDLRRHPLADPGVHRNRLLVGRSARGLGVCDSGVRSLPHHQPGAAQPHVWRPPLRKYEDNQRPVAKPELGCIAKYDSQPIFANIWRRELLLLAYIRRFAWESVRGTATQVEAAAARRSPVYFSWVRHYQRRVLQKLSYDQHLLWHIWGLLQEATLSDSDFALDMAIWKLDSHFEWGFKSVDRGGFWPSTSCRDVIPLFVHFLQG